MGPGIILALCVPGIIYGAIGLLAGDNTPTTWVAVACSLVIVTSGIATTIREQLKM